MGLNPVVRAGYRLFGERASRSPQLVRVEQDLRQAHITVRADAFLAAAWFGGLLVAILAAALAILGFLLLLTSSLPPLWGVPLLAMPGLAYFATVSLVLAHPKSVAAQRRKDIDMRLPYAAHYVTAMASAGIIPSEIFKSLARQEVYGEVAREAAWVYKDMEVHGKDVVTAMRRAIDRTPSDKFRDFLQGGITTVTSGGDLTAYFATKARRLQFDNQEVQKNVIETVGLISEAYVTAAVAGPLFLLVMIAVFVLMGVIEVVFLQLIVYLMLPVTAVGFLVAIKSQIPEV